MVMNAPPQGRGGYTGTDAGAAGFVQPPNILEDRDAAISRLLRMVGLSPSSLSPAAQAIRKKAGALANELVLRAGQAGGNADILADPGQSLTALAGIVKEGLAGGKIFGGGGAKLGALENLAALGAQAEAGGTGVSPGMTIIQQLLANPSNASELFRQAKYGGLSEKAQAGMALALETTLDTYRQSMEQGGLGAPGGGYGALLSTLLGKPVGGTGQAPTDASGNPIGGAGSAGMGVGSGAGANLPGGAPPPSMLGLPAGAQGTPSTAQAASPSALANPAAYQLPPPEAVGPSGMSAYDPQMLMALLGGGAPPAAPPPDLTGYGGGQPQELVGANPSFQPFAAQNYLPEPLATLSRIGGGFRR